MFDFKFHNVCNHRIINEVLSIQGEYPNYYAQLKRKAVGNNSQIIIKDQNNIFLSNEDSPINIKYTLGNDFKTLCFNLNNNIQVDARSEIYPINIYYATYFTNQDECPKCMMSPGTTNDFYLDVLGKPNITYGFQLLIQKFKKALITQLKSNVFDENYGSDLVDLIGKPKTALIVLLAQQTIYNVVDYIKAEQSQNYALIDDEEKLLKIDNFQINPTTTPKLISFTFELYNVNNENSSINIGL